MQIVPRDQKTYETLKILRKLYEDAVRMDNLMPNLMDPTYEDLPLDLLNQWFDGVKIVGDSDDGHQIWVLEIGNVNVWLKVRTGFDKISGSPTIMEVVDILKADAVLGPVHISAYDVYSLLEDLYYYLRQMALAILDPNSQEFKNFLDTMVDPPDTSETGKLSRDLELLDRLIEDVKAMKTIVETIADTKFVISENELPSFLRSWFHDVKADVPWEVSLGVEVNSPWETFSEENKERVYQKRVQVTLGNVMANATLTLEQAEGEGTSDHKSYVVSISLHEFTAKIGRFCFYRFLIHELLRVLEKEREKLLSKGNIKEVWL